MLLTQNPLQCPKAMRCLGLTTRAAIASCSADRFLFCERRQHTRAGGTRRRGSRLQQPPLRRHLPARPSLCTGVISPGIRGVASGWQSLRSAEVNHPLSGKYGLLKRLIQSVPTLTLTKYCRTTPTRSTTPSCTRSSSAPTRHSSTLRGVIRQNSLATRCPHRAGTITR